MAEKEYISREAVCGALNHIGGCDASDEWSKGWDKAIDTAIDIIEKAPAADATSVKYGHWVEGDGYVICSCCGRCYDNDFEVKEQVVYKFRFCPDCGAKMSNTHFTHNERYR